MGRFITDAVSSILRQAARVDEIIVIDSGSTDNTEKVIQHLASGGAPIRIVQAPRSGPGPARNVGLREATGDLIAFLDADDLWPREKLGRQLAYLDTHSGLDMVSGFVTYFDRLDPTELAPAPASRTETVFGVPLGSCLYRRSVFDRIGMFDESFLYGEDVDLLLRVREAAVPFTILRAVTLFYRRHDNSMMMRPDPRKKTDF